MAVHTEYAEARVPVSDESRPYRIKPLKGQVLLKVQPKELTSLQGLILPDIIDVFGTEKRPLRKAFVVSMGAWKTTKSGLSILPDISPGKTVLVSEYSGLKCILGVSEEFRLCAIDDVLAIVEHEIIAQPAKANCAI